MAGTPTLDRIAVHPVKSLDPHPVDRATVLENGGLTHDREFAMVDAEGNYVNGKRERATHRLRSRFHPPGGVGEDDDGPALSLRPNDGERWTRFSLVDGERGPLEAWLTDYFGYEVRVERDVRGGYPDDTHAAGPTVVANGTLAAVASWFDFDANEARRRLRPNLVVDAPAFWEDRLYSSTDRERVVPFSIGDVTFEGVNPCQRCVVPSRDPDTGEETPGFRERFVERRRETRPEWAGEAWFDHDFRLMVNTTVPPGTVGETVAIDDPVVVGEERSR
jgi:uncharacterized protein YcbX